MAAQSAEQRMREMVERAGPKIRDAAAASESGGRLAPEAMDALIDAGVLRAFLPPVYGGAELGPVNGTKLFEELATYDSAAAWVGMISSAGAWLTILLPPRAADEMLGDPRAVINGSLFPPMMAVRVQGGYRVSGRTSFVSGCEHATWFGTQALILENGAPQILPNGMPVSALIHFRASDAKVVPHWDTLGMRGTGSHDLETADVFVPDHLAWPMGPFAPVNPAFTDSTSRIGLGFFSPITASVALGVARSAVADLIDLAQAKVPNYSQTTLADRQVVQDQVARAKAMVDAARSYLYASLADAEEAVRSQPRLTIEQGIPLALAASHAGEAAANAVDLVHSCAGTSGIRNELRFQQYFRDVHTLTQHAFMSASRFESVGKLMLGRESDWALYYL